MTYVFTFWAARSESDQVFPVDLICGSGRELFGSHRNFSAAPVTGGIAIIDALKVNSDAVRKRTTFSKHNFAQTILAIHQPWLVITDVFGWVGIRGDAQPAPNSVRRSKSSDNDRFVGGHSRSSSGA